MHNREILLTGNILPYMDFLLHAAYVTDVIGNLQLINRNLTPHLYIGDMTFMDTSEGIKTDHPDMESIYCCSKIQQHFEIMSFDFTDASKCFLIEECTY